MLVGIVDFGQFLFFHQVLTDRARAGARYAAVNPYNATSIQNVVVYNSPTAPNGNPTGLFGLTTSNVTVTDKGFIRFAAKESREAETD
jgi:hypothetical protein